MSAYLYPPPACFWALGGGVARLRYRSLSATNFSLHLSHKLISLFINRFLFDRRLVIIKGGGFYGA